MRQNPKRWFGKQNLLRLLAAMLACMMPVVAAAQVSPVAFAKDSSAKNGLVRVKLSSLGNPATLTLQLNGSYSVNDGQIPLASGTQVKINCNSSTGQMTLSASGDSWNMGEYFTLNRHGVSDSAVITQSASGNPYPADFSFRSERKNGGYALMPVAHVQMEDYLYGVLPYEMGNSSPLEALKAQAIAARTYTIRMMEQRSGNTYDVVDTTADQLYKGTLSGNANCKAAVDATQGMVLKFGSRYAETYYSSSNGGQTESARNIWGGKGYDYLRVTDDPYDLASGSAKTKTATIYKDLAHGSNRQGLLTLLKQKAVSCLKQNGYAATTSNTQLIRLDSLLLHTPKYSAPSKLYTKADFKMSVETVAAGGGSVKTSVVVTADIFSELEKLFGMSLQSSSNEIWTLTSTNTAYTLKAGRFGHGVGMSQHGAMEMARQGYSYDAILGFYYPGCTNVRLNLSDAPMDDAGSTLLPEVPADDAVSGSETDSSAGNPDTTPESTPDVKHYAIVQANGFLNLRQSPSLDAAILGIALEGDTVQVIRLENDWAYVEYNGLQAYAMCRLLSDRFEAVNPEENTPSEEPSAEQTIPPQPEAIVPVSSNRVMICCTNGFVNFRETPDLSGAVLMQLPHGAEMDKLGISGEFTKVSYMGIEGYVMSAFLMPVAVFAPQSPSEDVPALESTPLQPQETPSLSENGYQTAFVATQRGSLNMRQQPYDYAAILTQIPQNSLVEVQPFNTEWYRVRYQGMDGYAMSRFISLSNAPQPTPSPVPAPSIQGSGMGKARVTTVSGSLNLRMTPESNGSILRTIPQGAMVEVHSINGQWALVSYREYSGYVRNEFLTMVTEGQYGESDNIPSTPAPAPVHTSEPVPGVTQQPSSTEIPAEPPKTEYNGQLTELPYGFTPVENTVAMAGAGSARFHLSPSLSERLLYVISASEQFPVLACSQDWCVGIWNDVTGYVPLSDVTLYPTE